MPAYNAEKTLQQTYDEIPKDTVDEKTGLKSIRRFIIKATKEK